MASWETVCWGPFSQMLLLTVVVARLPQPVFPGCLLQSDLVSHYLCSLLLMHLKCKTLLSQIILQPETALFTPLNHIPAPH